MPQNTIPQVDIGMIPDKPKTRPLQFKRGKASAFRRVNPILMKGEPAFEWDTCKLKVGNGYTCYNRLPYIGDHNKPKDGKSAYQIWLDAGNEGTVEDFLESLIGEQGKSTYEIWLSLGHEGTVVDFIDSIKGESTFETWKKVMHLPEATEEDFISYLLSESWEEF